MSEAPELAAFGPSLGERVLDALALLGGTASTLEVHGKVTAGGFEVSRGSVSVKLNELSYRLPPVVTALGGPHDGPGRSRLWRLGPPEAGEDGAETAFPPRETAQPEAHGRLPVHEPCGFLRDSLGHVWACLAPGRRLRP